MLGHNYKSSALGRILGFPLSPCCRVSVVFAEVQTSDIASKQWSNTMTVKPEEILDSRVPNPAELAKIVKAMREQNKWSQATLAELSGLNDRTVQRVENGEPSSLDTRRALARAFGHHDLDIFDKPWPFPNVEKLKAFTAEIEKTTVLVPLTKIEDGRTLRIMIEGTSSYAVEEIGKHSQAACESFAAIVDYLSDYNDIRECYSMSQRISVDRDIDALLKTIFEENAVIGAGLRHARIRMKSDASGLDPMDWTNIYMVLCQNETLPSSLRVPRTFKFG
jgi:transcriptional regulator with XRE-family HTH domain